MKTKLKVVADEKIPFLKGILDTIIDIQYLPADEITHSSIKDADAIFIRTRTRCNLQLLENTKVKFIGTATIGYDHIDTTYCKNNGIFWVNAPGSNANSVMQYVASALSSLHKTRNINFSDRTIGIIGYGNVGKRVSRLAEILGMRVLINDPPLARIKGMCGFVSLETLLKESDIITIHVPLTYDGNDKTYHLFNAEMFQKINKGSIFINTSRGEVVDSLSLFEAIKKGIVSDAVIDVWENEPFVNENLLQVVTIGTPHIAGYSADGKANATRTIVQEFCKYFHIFNLNLKIELPLPTENHIILSSVDCNTDTLLSDCILKTYNINNDAEKLLNDYGKFEEYRGNYPLRREFHAYTIIGKGIVDDSIYQKLKDLGFTIK